MGEQYFVAIGARLHGGRHAAGLVPYTGVIALSAQGAADPYATNPPGQAPIYPNAPCGYMYGAKHQAWAFDSDHGDFIVGGGDINRDSEVDLFTYNAATKQFAPLLLRAAAGAGEPTFDHSIISLSITSGGSGYTDGNYPAYSPGMPGVPLSGGTGTGAEARIAISGGVITSCNVFSSGYGYTVGDVLTVNAAAVGGTGSGFTVAVTAISPAGTPSSIVGPVGRCLPGYAYDATRSVLWMEGGSPRASYIYPDGFANNLVKGGLWALDRSETPLVWHKQGPGLGESAAGIAHGQRYDNYSSGLYFDAVGDALYSIVNGIGIYKYPLSGVSVDDISRDLWTFYACAPVAGENHGGFHAFDTLRRRIVFWSSNTRKTYAWNCATDTYVVLGSFDPPFNTDYNMTYDSVNDRVVLWIAGQYGAPYDDITSPGYYGDYQGRRTHVMYQMDGGGSWSVFTPVGDQLIAEDCQYAQVSGAYDPVNKCLVMMVANQTNDANLGHWFSPPRWITYHLSSNSTPAWRSSMTANTWRTIPASNKLSDIDPAQNPAMNPNYPSPPEWANSNAGVVAAWCGACYDQATDTLWFPLSAGHADGAGNEPYKICINAETPQFVMLRPPSGAIGNILTTNDGQDVTGRYSDGRPRAIHSYNKPVYVPGVGPFTAVLGETCAWGAIGGTGETIRLHETTGESTFLAANSWAIGASSEFGGTAYDPVRHCIWFMPSSNGSKITKYDIATNTWSQVGEGITVASNSACYLPNADCVLVFCHLFTNGIGVFDCATSTWSFPTRSGSLVGGVNLGVSTYGAVAPVWVPSLNAVAFWDNSSNTTQINILTLPANPRTGNWVASQLPVSGSNTVTPTVKTAAGTYGRFQYSQRLNGFVLLNATNQDCYFYALG